jgi:cold shock CspA family protein
MGRSQETSNKKEVRTRKEKKRKEKEQKRAKKKSEGTKSFDDMIAYVDEFGMITSTPPDPSKRVAVSAESIELKITRNNPLPLNTLHKGVVTFFNKSKGYGFINDLETQKNVFVHINNVMEPIEERSVVVFEMGKGPKGPSAMKVRIFDGKVDDEQE